VVHYRPVMKKILFVLLLICTLSAPVLGQVAGKQLVDRVIAVVNDEVITQSEFDIVFRPIYEQIKSAYQGEDLQRQVHDVRLKLLNQLIEDRLVYQEAKEAGIEILDSEIREEVEKFKKQFPDEDTYQREIDRIGLSQEDLEQQFRERLSISRLHQYVIRSKVIVSPTEVQQYFEEHKDTFVQKDEIDAWSITIQKSDDAVLKGIKDEDAFARAESIREQLSQGADFEELAKAHSEDAGAANGGHVGFVQEGNFLAGIDEVIFSLPENSYSEVLETERGYHVFKVGERKAGKVLSFEEAREKIRDFLFMGKAHKRFTGWMEELKQKSYISIR
jgi:peptidyl-prolyl cis-trans isomerase SurA